MNQVLIGAKDLIVNGRQPCTSSDQQGQHDHMTDQIDSEDTMNFTILGRCLVQSYNVEQVNNDQSIGKNGNGQNLLEKVVVNGHLSLHQLIASMVTAKANDQLLLELVQLACLSYFQ